MAHYLEKLGLVFLVAVVFFIIKSIVNVVYTYVIGPAINKVDFKSKGKWALVTGSTDGIGKEYAKETLGPWGPEARRLFKDISTRLVETTGNPKAGSYSASILDTLSNAFDEPCILLAARGCDIVLVSRSMEKLKATASEIQNDYKVNTKIVQADFSEEGIYERIAKEIADLEIGTLVNNVGISYSYPEYFTDIADWENTITTLIRANMVSVTRMTGIVLPDMVKRGKGVVINIGSGSSIIPSPLLTVYAACKAYVDKFSEGLDMEYSKKGIIVQCVLPGFVCSNMSGIRRASLIAPTAKTFVKSAISLVGTTSKTTGYFPHSIFVNTINAIYGVSAKFAVWLVTRSMENTRRKALKKYKNK